MLNVTLSLDGATWGELRKLVALADGIPDGEEIGLDYDENADMRGIFLDLTPRPKGADE